MTDYLSVAAAAARLGVSRRWLYEQVEGRAVPHHRFGRTIRFSPADLAAIEQATAVPAQISRRLRSTG